MIRIAAIGDVHLGTDGASRLVPHYAGIASRADVLLVAGDLTQHGLVDEGKVAAEWLASIPIPVAVVLGNHDYHRDAQNEMRRSLEDEAGVHVLEGESVTFVVRGTRIGIVGVKGFGGGFGGSSGSEFGEPEMKQFIHASKRAADALHADLTALDCDLRIALLHYAPTRTTLQGEKVELYPFLGSYLLGEAIDRAGCDLAVHGHAHHGTERGLTDGGVPVRNVAMPVLGAAYSTYEFAAAERTLAEAPAP